MNIAAIDLLCGIRGLKHGLEKAGLTVIAGIETNLAVNMLMRLTIGLNSFKPTYLNINHIKLKFSKSMQI